MRIRLAWLSLAVAAGGIEISAGQGKGPKVGVTFTRDVAPILQKNCQTCHRPGEIGPMALRSYEETRPWAKAIREAVVARKMPPWHTDTPRQFENDPRLSDRDIRTITDWVDAGAPKGDASAQPADAAFPEGWSIGKPDIVFSMSDDYAVPAEGVVPYKYFVVPTNFKEDTWVQAAEIRPGNRSVVHHVIVLVREPGAGAGFRDPGNGRQRGGPEPEGAQGQGRSPESRLDTMLVGTAPGMPAFVFKPGYAKRIKAGSSLVFQVHYTPNGSAERDRSSVGLILAKAPAERAVMTFPVGNDKFKIPPGHPNFEVKGSFTFPEDGRILSVMPHMHVRGKDFRYTAIYPDGRQEVILNVPRWDFNWQQIYRFKEPIAMPKGSRVECVAHYDNSPANKFNPDPTKEVYWGDQTWEEMMIGYMDFVFERPTAQKSSAAAN